jgi:hypothetical protein
MEPQNASAAAMQPHGATATPSIDLQHPQNRPEANAPFKWQSTKATKWLIANLDTNTPKKPDEWGAICKPPCSQGLVRQVAKRIGKMEALVLNENDGTLPLEFKKHEGGSGAAYLPSAAVALMRKLGIRPGRCVFGEWNGMFVLLPSPPEK